jgi:RNA polymerase sigma factor (TIGR02999 family)
MADITALLARWADGDPEALRNLMPLVYKELRAAAEYHLRQEREEHTLQPTALVHEVYLRLAGIRHAELRNRAQFFGAAANVMRRVLVDYARQRRARKRGGASARHVPLADTIEAPINRDVDFATLDEALTALERVAPERARVVELRYFGGLSIDETGEYLGIAPATVKRYWAFARAWLFRWLRSGLPNAANAR